MKFDVYVRVTVEADSETNAIEIVDEMISDRAESDRIEYAVADTFQGVLSGEFEDVIAITDEEYE